jgi:hypothetical protein
MEESQAISNTRAIHRKVFVLITKRSQRLIAMANTEKHPEFLRHLIGGHAAPAGAYISFVPYFVHHLLVCKTNAYQSWTEQHLWDSTRLTDLQLALQSNCSWPGRRSSHRGTASIYD